MDNTNWGAYRVPTQPTYRPQGQSTGVFTAPERPAPHTGWDNPWIGRGLMALNPVLGIGYRLWRGIHNRHQPGLPDNNPGWNPGSPGAGYNNGQLGNPYGGFGNGYGLTGDGYGSTGGSSYGSGQGFGTGLGALAGGTSGGTNQFGLPTGPVNLGGNPGGSGGSSGLSNLAQPPGQNFGSNPNIGLGFIATPTRDEWQQRAGNVFS
jgi:hypothetical protein